MPLPKVEVPTYELSLISNNKKIKFRPFLVKEEKILLIALQTENKKEIVMAIQQILQNCILTENVKIEELPSFDVEYLYLKIREKSLGEAIEVRVNCPDTNKFFDVSLDLSTIKVEKSKTLENNIKINDKVGMVMKYPTFSLMQTLIEEEDVVSRTMKIVMESIESIYDQNTTYNPKEFSEKEVQEFIESMPQETFDKINKFYESFPKIVFDELVTSPYTSKKVKVRLDEFMDFLG
jgi:hypothetical protein